MIDRVALLDRHIERLLQGSVAPPTLANAAIGDVDVATLARFADQLIDAGFRPLSQLQIDRGAALLRTSVRRDARAARQSWLRWPPPRPPPADVGGQRHGPRPGRVRRCHAGRSAE